LKSVQCAARPVQLKVVHFKALLYALNHFLFFIESARWHPRKDDCAYGNRGCIGEKLVVY